MSYDFYGNPNEQQQASSLQNINMQGSSLNLAQNRSHKTVASAEAQSNEFIEADQARQAQFQQQPNPMFNNNQIIPPPTSSFAQQPYQNLQPYGAALPLPEQEQKRQQQQKQQQEREAYQQWMVIEQKLDQQRDQQLDGPLSRDDDDSSVGSVLDKDKMIEEAANRVRIVSKQNQKVRKAEKKRVKNQKKAAKDFEAQNLDAPPVTVDQAKKQKVSDEESSNSCDSHEEDLRINAMKEAIIYEEKRRFKILSRKFKQDKDVDLSLGRCCCKFDNVTGAKCVKAIDLIFLPNFPRWVFALWATINEDKFPLYARMRLLSCWIFWLIGLIIIVFITSVEVASNDEIDSWTIIISLFYLILLIVCGMIDYHYSRVILIYARGHEKRKERQREELEKKERVDETLKRHATLVIEQGDGVVDVTNVNGSKFMGGNSFDSISKTPQKDSLKSNNIEPSPSSNTQVPFKSTPKQMEDWQKDLKKQLDEDESLKRKQARKLKKRKAKLHPTQTASIKQ